MRIQLIMTMRVLPKTDELPRALYRAEQVRALDRVAIERYGIAGAELMERAGRGAFTLLQRLWPDARDITVLVGTGNNGGDGYVVARLAYEAGFTVRVLQLGDPEKIRGDALLQAQRYQAAGGAWSMYNELSERTDVIVDGMLGTGLEREVSAAWAAAIEDINSDTAPVLALDIPSGLHADSGRAMGIAVHASATISFIGLKQGMFTGDGPACCGAVHFDALEVPARIYATEILSARRIDLHGERHLLHPRRATAHKGQMGHVLVVGGDRGFGGAARLTAEAAARSGAGLVSLATRPEHVAPVLSARPEIMVRGVVDADDLSGLLKQASVIAVGPGLGRDRWGRALWSRVAEVAKPLIVDADGLNLLAESPRYRDDWVLTPHPGEAARLLARNTSQIQADRFAAVRNLRLRFGGVALLKGAGTLVSVENTRPVGVCSSGNPGMASGGMGDVLTGVIAGLVAQGFTLGDATELGVCLHAAAADAAALDGGERGMLATDLMPQLRRFVNPR